MILPVAVDHVRAVVSGGSTWPKRRLSYWSKPAIFFSPRLTNRICRRGAASTGILRGFPFSPIAINTTKPVAINIKPAIFNRSAFLVVSSLQRQPSRAALGSATRPPLALRRTPSMAAVARHALGLVEGTGTVLPPVQQAALGRTPKPPEDGLTEEQQVLDDHIRVKQRKKA